MLVKNIIQNMVKVIQSFVQTKLVSVPVCKRQLQVGLEGWDVYLLKFSECHAPIELRVDVTQGQ